MESVSTNSSKRNESVDDKINVILQAINYPISSTRIEIYYTGSDRITRVNRHPYKKIGTFREREGIFLTGTSL